MTAIFSGQDKPALISDRPGNEISASDRIAAENPAHLQAVSAKMKQKIVIDFLQKKHFVVLLGDLKIPIRRLAWIFPGGTHLHGFAARH